MQHIWWNMEKYEIRMLYHKDNECHWFSRIKKLVNDISSYIKINAQMVHTKWWLLQKIAIVGPMNMVLLEKSVLINLKNAS